MSIPWFWIIGGPNGAGKTTFCFEFLKSLTGTPNYVNADLIAAGLVPLAPSSRPVLAAKTMLGQVSGYIRLKKSFAVETTLSGNTWAKQARKLKRAGWKIGLVYLWLETPEIALRRVEERVRKGGHSIPPLTVLRRLARGRANLRAYVTLADEWAMFDNSTERLCMIARHSGGKTKVKNKVLFNRMLP